jgi:hypothetical protein
MAAIRSECVSSPLSGALRPARMQSPLSMRGLIRGSRCRQQQVRARNSSSNNQCSLSFQGTNTFIASCAASL